jgi:rare lipoprotein A (peptidoglycan hydrolase)
MDIIGRQYFSLRLLALFFAILWLQGVNEARCESSQQDPEAVAERVEKQAKRSEKAEGKHNLVKDTVTTKTNPEGETVVEQVGEASFYGKGHQGKETASGERFDQRDLTAAHPTLPLGTDAKVTNLETGESVDVRINDRGPYVKGRDLDLSKEAAKEIGMKKEGEAPVKIEAELPQPDEQTPASSQDENKTSRKK